MKKSVILTAATVAALSSFPALSQAEAFNTQENLFASLHLGNTDYDSRGDGTTGFRARMGLNVTSLIPQLPERFSAAAEAHYTLYGQETNEYQVFFSKVEEKLTFSGMGLGGRLGFDATDKIRVYGNVGLERLAVDYDVEIDGESFSEEELDSSIELYYGFGARYTLDKTFGLQAEYKSVDEVSFLSVGLSFDY